MTNTEKYSTIEINYNEWCELENTEIEKTLLLYNVDFEKWLEENDYQDQEEFYDNYTSDIVSDNLIWYLILNDCDYKEV